MVRTRSDTPRRVATALLALLVLASCRSRSASENGASGAVGAKAGPGLEDVAVDDVSANGEPEAEPGPPLDAAAIVRLADDLVNLYGPTVSSAMLSLARAGSAAVPELTKRLESADVNMRYRALIVLGRIGDREAEPSIRKLLDDPSESVRVSARIALLRFGAREELPALLALATSSESQGLQAAALSGLATLRVEEALPAFRQGIRSSSADVRYWSVQGIRALEDRASAGELVTLLCDPNAGVAGAAADALRALATAETHADVAKAFAVAQGVQRAEVLELLHDLPHAEIATFVRQAVADESPEVRAIAMRLAPRTAPDARAAIGWLETGARDASSSTVRSLALRGLSLVGGDRARSLLAHALFDEDPFCRYNACAGLARVGATDLVSDLARVEASDPIVLVRSAARRARARLGEWAAVEALVADLDDSLSGDAAHATLAAVFGEDFGRDGAAWREKVLSRGRDAYRFDGDRRRFVASAG